MYFCKYAKSKEKVLFYPYSSLFLEYKLKIQSIGVSNGLCCIFYLTVSSHLKSPGKNVRNQGNHGIINPFPPRAAKSVHFVILLCLLVITMIASVSFVILTGNLICNFPQTGQISNFPLINMHEQILPRLSGTFNHYFP